MKYNFTDMRQQVAAAKRTKKKWSSPVNIDQLIPIMGCIHFIRIKDVSELTYDTKNIPNLEDKVGKVSASLTLKSLVGKKFKTINGDTYTGEEIAELFKLMHECPRGWLVSKMTNNPYYASMTPVGMLAAKEFRDIQYNEWDRDDPALLVFIGTFLAPLLTFKEGFTLPGLVSELRKDALTIQRGYNVGQIRPHSSNHMSLKMKHEGEEVPFCVNYMLLQTWLCNSQYRTDSMILDPYDWDKWPEPFDRAVAAPSDDLDEDWFK